jgi:hypothetical protein
MVEFIIGFIFWIIVGYLAIARFNAFNDYCYDFENPHKEHILVLICLFVLGIVSFPIGLGYYYGSQKLFNFNFRNKIKWW